MKDNWLDKHQLKIFWLTWGLIIACCIFIFFSNTAHASTSSHKLPYDYSWNYYAIPEQTLNIALNHASSYFDTSQDNVIVFWYEIGNGSWLYQFCVAQVDSITYDSGYTYDTTDLTLNKITLHFSHSVIGFTDGNSLVDPCNQAYAPQSYTFFGSNAVFVQPTGSVTETYTHMPLYGTVELDGKLIIGTPENGPDIITGHATEPINDPDNLIGSIDGHPVPKPDAPTIQTYVPPAPQFPQIDTSTLESLLESLIDVVVYGFGYIKDILSGFFSNLLSNLQEIAEFISQSIYYAINKVIQSIQDLATDFYNNMVSLFEPLLNGITEMISGIKDRIDYFFEDFDSSGAIDYYENNCSFYTLSTMSFGFISDLHTGLSGVQAPQRLVFHIDFTNAPFPFNTVGTLDINFDWYEGLRHTIVPWILVFLYFGVLYSFVMQIPNIIHGTSGLFSPHLTETNTITAIETSSSNGIHYTDSYSTVVKSYSSIFGSFSRATSSNSNVSRRKK